MHYPHLYVTSYYREILTITSPVSQALELMLQIHQTHQSQMYASSLVLFPLPLPPLSVRKQIRVL